MISRNRQGFNAERELSVEANRILQRAWACFRRYNIEICDRLGVRSRLKVRMLDAEVIETPLYGRVTWRPNKPDYDRLRQVHHSMNLRYIGWRKQKRDDGTISYASALAKTDSESINVTLRKRRILFAGIRGASGEGAPATEGDVWGAE